MAEPTDGQKLIPESDLMAYKAKVSKDIDSFKSQLEETKKQADTHYTNLLATQAARDKLAAELEELKKEVEGLRPLSAAKESADKRVKELENQLLEATIRRLVQVHKIPEDKLKGKSFADLSALEEALKLVGRDTSRFDTGVVAGGGAEKLSAMQKLRAGFEQLQKQKT
jgi:chromosome segregation ATPase